jgi:hypothetical protein
MKINKSEYKLFTVDILVPIRNEEDVIVQFIEEWQEEVLKYLSEDSRLVFEDGGSHDGTVNSINILKQKFSNITLFERKFADGFGNSVQRLILGTKADWFFLTDGDGQFIPSDFWKMIIQTKFGYSLIKGAKIVRNDSLYRRLNSLFFNKFINFLFNSNFADINAGFLLCEKSLAHQILRSKLYIPNFITTELVLRAYLQNDSIKQVFVLHRKRVNGKSRSFRRGTYTTTGIKSIIGLFQLKKSYKVSEN